MDTTNLKETYPHLISHFEAAGYSGAYVAKVKREIENILQLAESSKVSSYDDVYLKHEQSARFAPITLKVKRNVIRAIERFDLLGHYPDATNKRALHLKNPRYKLCDEFKAVIDCFIETEMRRGTKKESSVQTQSNNGTMFLFALQQLGVFRLADVKEENIFEVFSKFDGSTK